MSKLPVAAGKSSIGHVDQDLVFNSIARDGAATYLDLACGAGRYALALAGRVGNDSVIYALDLWEEGVASLQEAARENGFASIKAMTADITAPLPLADGRVDVCYIATVLHDPPENARGRVMDEVRRVLAPEGVLAVIEFKKLDHGPGPRKEHRIGEAEAEALAAAHGFRKDLVVDLGEFTYLARFIAS